MKVDLFDFDLPPERIALRPKAPRDAARLLAIDNGATQDRQIGDLPALLSPGDIMVFNDTKVIPALLSGTRGRSSVDVNLHKEIDPYTWRAFARPARKLRPGDRVDFPGGLAGSVSENCGGGEIVLKFEKGGTDLRAALEVSGQMPLPPYIARRRAPDERDQHDYQTIFGTEEGAVAAPILTVNVTLHVGAGTFLPVRTQDTKDHPMHSEACHLSGDAAERINRARGAGGRVVAVGTTALRILETAVGPDGTVFPFDGDTSLFITPGYSFKAVDLLLSNFHLPRSTLFLLVCAFAGTDTMQAAYKHAIDQEYRFYSYGDCTLLYPVAPS